MWRDVTRRLRISALYQRNISFLFLTAQKNAICHEEQRTSRNGKVGFSQNISKRLMIPVPRRTEIICRSTRNERKRRRIGMLEWI